jgi:Homeobox KN domain/Tc5 transposase DNA-binding domain
VQSNGEMTGMKALRSWDRTPLDHPEDDERSSRKTGTRFSREAVKIMKSWMDVHRDHPYPTDEEKEELKDLTGLKGSQISNWLANTRRRTKARSSRGASPSMLSPTWPTSSEAINIPSTKQGVLLDGKTWDIMNPLERWQVSPPDNEPASATDIAHAVANIAQTSSNASSLSRNHSRNNLHSSPESGSLHALRAPSISSLGTGQSDSIRSSNSFSNHSLASSHSRGSRNSLQSRGSGRQKEKRRHRRTAANPSRFQGPTVARPFQCTFCTDTFRTKYDWTRHEKSLHLSLEKWICAPIGGVITSSSNGTKQCVYCGATDPSREHLETHNHFTCSCKEPADRTFYRKDHLRQHLRLVHGCPMIGSMETWKSEASFIRSRCGFCDEHFTTWAERNDHLAKHFRAGAKMKDWKSCRGFDAAISALVTNSMPPYLIGNESNSIIPFSASNEASLTHHLDALDGQQDVQSAINELAMWNSSAYLDAAQHAESMDLSMTTPGMSSNQFVMGTECQEYTGSTSSMRVPKISTCWEILTVRLGLFVKERMMQGVPITDEMLQAQARWIIYESDDSWNQTSADNPEWLELFKRAHGLPNVASDAFVDMVEDLGAGVDDMSFDAFFQDSAWNAPLPATELNATQYSLG